MAFLSLYSSSYLPNIPVNRLDNIRRE